MHYAAVRAAISETRGAYKIYSSDLLKSLSLKVGERLQCHGRHFYNIRPC